MISFDSEKCMEDFFFEYHEHYESEFNLHPDYVWSAKRQVQLGSHGTCDILFTSLEDVGHDIHVLRVRLVELKNTELTHSHVSQVARYADFFRRLAEQGPVEVDFSASLVGLKTFPSGSDLVYLCQSIDWLAVYESTISPVDGVTLKRTSGWRPTSHTTKSFDGFLGACGFELVPEKEVGNG